MPVLFPGLTDPVNIRVLSTGCIELAQWWAKTDTLRTFWRMYLTEEDGVVFRLPDCEFELPAGRLCLIPPGLEFDIELAKPVNCLYMHFELVGWTAEAIEQVFPQPVALEPDLTRDALAQRLWEDVVHESRRIESVLSGRLKSLIHLVVSDVMAHVPKERAGCYLTFAASHQEMVKVLLYIDRHLDENLSTSRLAEVASTSEARFIRRFREAMGQTPVRYVQERRVGKAARMLLSSDDSIDEVAERCGFANRYYFSRVFAKRMGTPPAKYRSDFPRM